MLYMLTSQAIMVGDGSTGIFSIAKISRTENAEYSGVLSWCKSHDIDFYALSLQQSTFSLNHSCTCFSKTEFTVWTVDTIV